MNKTKTCHCCRGSGTELDHAMVGAEMRAWRKSKHASLKKVGASMSPTRSVPYLSDLERGKRNWNENLINKFKRACL